MRLRLLQTGLIIVDDDPSPEVLETIGAAANIYEDDPMTPDGGKLMVGQDMLILQHTCTGFATIP